MEVGVRGQNGVSVLIRGFRGPGTATTLPLYMDLLVREKTKRRRTVVRHVLLDNANMNLP